MTAQPPATSDAKQANKDRLVRQGFLPIYVHDPFDSRTLIEGAIEAGCTVLEYTCRRHDARQMIPWIKKHYPEVTVFGATMMDGPRVSAFLAQKREHFIPIEEMVDLGVDGLVSFMRYLPETYEKYAKDLVMIPGVGSANEAMDQLEWGADFVKISTGKQAGVDLFMGTRVGAHHALPVLCSGGVTVERAGEFIGAGAVLCSAGFDLVLKDRMCSPNDVDTALVRERVGAYLTQISETRRATQPEVAQAVASGRADVMGAGPWVT